MEELGRREPISIREEEIEEIMYFFKMSMIVCLIMHSFLGLFMQQVLYKINFTYS